MASSKADLILARAFTEAHEATAVESGTAEIIEPTMIMAFIAALFDFIKGCRNKAEARMREGGGLAFGAVRKALMSSGYLAEIDDERERNKRVRKMARELTKKGETCTQEELDAILADAADVPEPPATSGPWPFVIAVACVLGFGSMATASDGPWPQIAQDVTEIKSTVTTLGSSVATLSSRMARIEDEQRASAGVLNRLADHLLPASQSPVCEPTPADAPVDRAAKTLDSILAESPPDNQKLEDIYATIEAMSKELESLRASRTVRTKPPANTLPASSSGVTLNGMSIGDVNAYIRQNPAGYVGVNGSLDLHLRQHGFGGNLSSLSRSQQQSLHNIAHARGMPARTIYHTSASTSKPAASYSTGCANGNCFRSSPSYGTSSGQWKQGLFGRWRQVN